MQNANGTRKGGGGDWGGSGTGAERRFHAESTEGRGLSRWAPARSGRRIDREDWSTHKRPLASASLVIGRPSRSTSRHARPTGDVTADSSVDAPDHPALPLLSDSNERTIAQRRRWRRPGRRIDREARSTHKRPLASASLV